jgi:hypothetical protein
MTSYPIRIHNIEDITPTVMPTRITEKSEKLPQWISLSRFHAEPLHYSVLFFVLMCGCHAVTSDMRTVLLCGSYTHSLHAVHCSIIARDLNS